MAQLRHQKLLCQCHGSGKYLHRDNHNFLILHKLPQRVNTNNAKTAYFKFSKACLSLPLQDALEWNSVTQGDQRSSVLLWCFLIQSQMWTFYFALFAIFFIGFWNGFPPFFHCAFHWAGALVEWESAACLPQHWVEFENVMRKEGDVQRLQPYLQGFTGTQCSAFKEAYADSSKP